MRKVERNELLGLADYETIRERFRNRVIALKARRRIALGPNITLTFENHDTVLLQVQEMLRTERISGERAIEHELATYNELIPPAGALSATMFIEYTDVDLRREMLQKLGDLRTEIRLRIGSEESVAHFGSHFGEELDRLPSVNYLTFQLGAGAAERLSDNGVPAMLAATHPLYRAEAALPAALREELADDLSQ